MVIIKDLAPMHLFTSHRFIHFLGRFHPFKWDGTVSLASTTEAAQMQMPVYKLQNYSVYSP